VIGTHAQDNLMVFTLCTHHIQAKQPT